MCVTVIVKAANKFCVESLEELCYTNKEIPVPRRVGNASSISQAPYLDLTFFMTLRTYFSG